MRRLSTRGKDLVAGQNARKKLDEIAERLECCLVIPTNDRLFERLDVEFLLTEDYALVPLADIPEDLRLLYRLKYQ